MKKYIQLSPRCLLCGEEEVETVNHLFLHCRITNILWNVFINQDMKKVMPRKVMQTLKLWSSYASITGHKERWKIIPACNWWSVWKERNLICFQNKRYFIQKIKMNCLVLFLFWCKQEYMVDLESIKHVLGSL